MKKLTVVIPTIKRNWKNPNIYTIYVTTHLEILLTEFHIVNKNDKQKDWAVTSNKAGQSIKLSSI